MTWNRLFVTPPPESQPNPTHQVTRDMKFKDTRCLFEMSATRHSENYLPFSACAEGDGIMAMPTGQRPTLLQGHPWYSD